jgi:hypothetical protein
MPRTTSRTPYTSNTILKHDNATKDAVIGAKKRRLSGKRMSINGKHIMTAEESIAIRGCGETEGGQEGCW